MSKCKVSESSSEEKKKSQKVMALYLKKMDTLHGGTSVASFSHEHLMDESTTRTIHYPSRY
jgi:hypothetical protein